MDRFKASSVRMFIFGFVCTVIALLIVAWCLYKEPIQNATMSQLEAINGIGEVLACEIYDYVKLNPSCEVGDLIVIDGIGQVRLEVIERSFR